VSARAARVTWWAAAAAVIVAGCGGRDADDDARVQGAALRHLFRERERAGRLVVWADAAEAGPVFAALGVPADGADMPPVDARTADGLAAAVGVPVTLASAIDMTRLFRENPDGWKAFYWANPGTPGLVELGRVRYAGRTATVVVGRSCGEHCLHAWRVTLSAGGGGAWRATAVEPLRVPSP
jgi:hypothetical protein